MHRLSRENGGAFRCPATLDKTNTGGLLIVHRSVRIRRPRIQIDRCLALAQAIHGLSDGQLRPARQIADRKGPIAAAETPDNRVNTARPACPDSMMKPG
ncbi:MULTISPECIES: hypothetical protein [unclassified Mameliella]|uniref:hypothetical protein n=1 Tax=unclassified Mameliella TaxID=2630630 RepID=UPI00273FF320|nr:MULTISPECIES: hypothetical protein [unclassified Mameliella]